MSLNAAAVCLADVTEWFTGEPWRHFGLLASRTGLAGGGGGRKNSRDLRWVEGRRLTAAITATPVGSQHGGEHSHTLSTVFPTLFFCLTEYCDDLKKKKTRLYMSADCIQILYIFINSIVGQRPSMHSLWLVYF